MKIPVSNPAAEDGHAFALRPYILFIIGIALFFQVGAGLLVGTLGLPGVALAQILFLGIPALVFAARRAPGVFALLNPRAVPVRRLLAAGVMGTSIWVCLFAFLLPIQMKIWPIPEDFLQQRARLFSGLEGPFGIAILVMSGAIIPAMCEELIFRGILLDAFRRYWNSRRALVWTAGLFALFHGTLHQFLVTFVLGLIMGWMALRSSSLIPPMVYHFANNTTVLLVTAYGGDDFTRPVIGAALFFSIVGSLLFLAASSGSPRSKTSAADASLLSAGKMQEPRTTE